MQRWVRWYYLATPVFFLGDWLWGVNVRVAFLDDFTTGRYAYYLLCVALGVVAWRRPALVPVTGLLESGASIALLVIATYRWYWSALESVEGAMLTMGPEALANFVLAATVAGISYTVQRARLV